MHASNDTLTMWRGGKAYCSSREEEEEEEGEDTLLVAPEGGVRGP